MPLAFQLALLCLRRFGGSNRPLECRTRPLLFRGTSEGSPGPMSFPIALPGLAFRELSLAFIISQGSPRTLAFRKTPTGPCRFGELSSTFGVSGALPGLWRFRKLSTACGVLESSPRPLAFRKTPTGPCRFGERSRHLPFRKTPPGLSRFGKLSPTFGVSGSSLLPLALLKTLPGIWRFGKLPNSCRRTKLSHVLGVSEGPLRPWQMFVSQKTPWHHIRQTNL